jgi:phosphatidylglycerophosphate synthase
MLKINQTPGGQIMRYTALTIFLFMCVSDALDGYMARVKKQTTKFGTFLDPIADKLLMTCACIILASTKTAVPGFTLPSAIVVMIIGKDLILLLGFILIFLITTKLYFKPIYAGKIATCLQLSMVAAILIAPEVSVLLPVWTHLTRILWWATAAVAVFITLVYIRNGIRYIEQLENGVKDS